MIEALNGLMEQHSRWEFRLGFDALRLEHRLWNHKWVYRVYKAMGLYTRRIAPSWFRRQLEIAGNSRYGMFT